MMNKNIALFGVSLAVVVADQLSKYWVLQNIAFRERVNVIPDFFDLTLVFNPGAAFSFLAGAGGWQKYFFLLLAAGICFWLAYSVIKQKMSKPAAVGAVMVIGGAIGNVIDRLWHGQVVDFLLFYWQNHYYPAFNIADSFICLGVFLMLMDGFVHKNPSTDDQAV